MADRYGLIGFPVKHSYSAAMHNAAFQELGLDACYELFEIAPASLEEGFRKKISEGVCGFNVTAPYKETIIQFLDELERDARLIGAVNTIKIDGAKRTKGYNTDGLGFITHLAKVIGFNPCGKRAAVLGAGGAARAVTIQLAKSGTKEVLLFDIERAKAEDLRAKIKKNFPACAVTLVSDANGLLQAKPHFLINATGIGMHKTDGLVFDTELLFPKLLVYDLIYNPAQTPLLEQAKRKGCAGVFNGLGMLLYQGVFAFKIWLDLEPPVEVMEKALLEKLREREKC